MIEYRVTMRRRPGISGLQKGAQAKVSILHVKIKRDLGSTEEEGAE